MTTISLANGATVLELDPDLYWDDEYPCAAVEQQIERSLALNTCGSQYPSPTPGECSMSKKNTHRASIQTELAAKEVELASLMTERRAFPDVPRGVSASTHPSFHRLGEVLRLIGDVEGRINSLKDQLAAIDKADAFAVAGTTAADDIVDAEALLAGAADAATRLMHRRAQVVAKADHFRGASTAQLELASAREQSAVAAYARAVSAGDDAAQVVAQDEITAAQADLADAQRGAHAQSGVIAALEAEVVALDKELTALRDQAEMARAALCTALRALYMVEWDRAVDALEQVGARYCATFTMTGSYYSGFSRLEIPRFDPSRPRSYFNRLPTVEIHELDCKTREHLASFFGATGRGITVSNKAA